MSPNRHRIRVCSVHAGGVTEPNWYPDPTGRFEVRYHDGAQWTAHVATAGVAGTDPMPDVQETVAVSSPTGPPGYDSNPNPYTQGPASPPNAGPPPGFGSFPTQEGWPPAEGSSGPSKGLVGLLAVLGAVVLLVVVGAFLLLGGDDDDGDTVEAASATGENTGDGDADGADASSTTGPSTTAPSTTISTTVTTASTTTTVPTTAAPPAGDLPAPTDPRVVIAEYGSDPGLDTLADDCQAGDMSSCDALFFQSAIDSGYEAYGDSCGGRNRPAGFCVSIYSQ